MKEKILNIILIVGLLIITAMALLPLLNIDGEWMRWLFAAGALMVLVVRVLERYDGDNLRIKRLYRINIISALLFCASAVMFWPSILKTTSLPASFLPGSFPLFWSYAK